MLEEGKHNSPILMCNSMVTSFQRTVRKGVKMRDSTVENSYKHHSSQMMKVNNNHYKSCYQQYTAWYDVTLNVSVVNS